MAIINPNSQALALIRRPGDIIWANGYESGLTLGEFSNIGGGATVQNTTLRTSGPYAGYAYTTSNNDNNGGSSVVRFGSVSEFIFGTAYYLSSFVSVQGPVRIFNFLADNSLNQFEVAIDSSGRIYVSRNGTVVETSSIGNATTQATWFWLDGKIKVDATNGYYQIRVNGNIVLDTAGVNTRLQTSSYVSGMVIGESDSNNGGVSFLDDSFIMDNAGNTVEYPGDIRVYDIIPTADGNYSQLSTSNGQTAHYSLVDDGVTPNDTDYVSGSIVGTKDTYTFGDLPSNATQVYAIQYVARAKKTDAGTRTMKFTQRQSGVDYDRDSIDFSLSNSYQSYKWIDNANPATGTAYTVAEINNGEWGVKVQS